MGSVRQLVDTNSDITYTKSYDPYGGVTQSSGAGQSAYGYTGEQQDANNMVYLRARYYNAYLNQFIQPDTIVPDPRIPADWNRYAYVRNNPINYVDPTGHFSESLIQASLHGSSLVDAFGQERYGVARWGLYEFLKNANSFDHFTLRIADFGYEGPNYPLAPDSGGEWAVYESGCDLKFVNNKWGFRTLPEFLKILKDKAEASANISNKWWRPSTLQYHWYESNGRFYSDYYQFSHMPALLVVSGGLFLGGHGSLGSIRDRYGNQYYSIGFGGTIGAGIAEHWEGYASINTPANFQRQWAILSESELKNIILAWSGSLSASTISTGAGISVNRAGTIALFGDINALMGLSSGLSYTWEASTKDFYRAWDWVDDIPGYGPPQK